MQKNDLIMFQKNVYMCPPDYLSLNYEINPWMDKENPFSLEKAIKQWNELFALYQNLIPGKIFKVEAKEGLTELCFLGDSLFAINNDVVYSRFAREERYHETEYVMEYFSAYLKGNRVPETIYYEGSGETMIWKNQIFVGYGQRSSKDIITYLSDIFKRDVYGLELITEKYYHLDTAFFPINETLIAIYPEAFSKESLSFIRNLDAEILELNSNDAQSFALNSVSLGNDLIIHKSAQNFIRLMREKGFTVHEVDISEFIKFGGGLKCLSFQHYFLS